MNHREPDRIPLHMNATSWALDKLNAELGTSNHRDLMEAIHLDTFDMRVAGAVIRGHVRSPLSFPPVRTVKLKDVWAIKQGLYQAAHSPLGTSISDAFLVKTNCWSFL